MIDINQLFIIMVSASAIGCMFTIMFFGGYPISLIINRNRAKKYRVLSVKVMTSTGEVEVRDPEEIGFKMKSIDKYRS